MYNLYEIEQLGQVRQQQLRDRAAQYHSVKGLLNQQQTMLIRLSVACGDGLIALGYKMKSWYKVDNVTLGHYQLDITDIR